MGLPGLDFSFAESKTQTQNINNIGSTITVGPVSGGFTPPPPPAVADVREAAPNGTASLVSNPVNLVWGAGILGGVLILFWIFRRLSRR